MRHAEITSMLVTFILVSANPDGAAKVEVIDAAQVASAPLLHKARTKDKLVRVGVKAEGTVKVAVTDGDEIAARPLVRKEPTKDAPVVHKEAEKVTFKAILDSAGEVEAPESAQGEEVEPPNTEIKQGFSATDQTNSSSSLASGATGASPPVQLDDRFPMDADEYEDATLDELEAMTISIALSGKDTEGCDRKSKGDLGRRRRKEWIDIQMCARRRAPPPVRRRAPVRRRRAIPCTWGGWTKHGDCTKTCGGGKISKVRKITRNAAHGGKACRPPSKKKVNCNKKVCPTTTTTTMTTAAGANRMVDMSASLLLSLLLSFGVPSIDA